MFSRSLASRLGVSRTRMVQADFRRLLAHNEKKTDQNSELERHASRSQSYSPYPWESDEVEDVETSSFPWDDLTGDKSTGTGAVAKETAVDPTRAELILGPMKKRSSRNRMASTSEGASFNMANNFKELLEFKHDISNTDLMASIDSLRPSETTISVNQLKEITKSMDRMCRRNHLVDYLKVKSPQLTTRVSSKALTKKFMIKAILTQLWDLKIDQSGADTSAEVTYTIDLTHKRDLFLLSSSRGVLFDHWSLMGAKLSINTSTKELIVKGSQNIVDFVQTSWNQMLNGVVCKKVSLGRLLEQFKTFNGSEDQWTELIAGIQQTTGAYFEVVDKEAQVYLVSAINKHVLRTVNTEFIKLMSFQDQSNTAVFSGLESGDAFRIDTPDKLLPWYVQSQKLSKLYKCKQRVAQSPMVINTVDTEELSRKVQQLQLDVKQAVDLFEYNFINSEEEMVKNQEKADTIDSFFDVEPTSYNDVNVDTTMAKIEATFVEDKLEPSTSLKFTEQNLISMAPTTSARFGHLLTSDLSKLTYFDTQLSDITRKISCLPLLNKSESVIGEAGAIKTNFSSHLSIKLASNVLASKSDNLPPLELVINLKGSTVELQTADQNRLWDLFLTEAEKTVQLPTSYEADMDYDISMNCSKNSLLVYNLQDCINNGKDDKVFKKIMEDETNNISLFNRASVNKSLNLINRKSWDIRKYNDFENLIKGISSKTFNLAIPVRNEDQSTMVTHKYHVVDVDLVKTLELDFLGSPLVYEVRDNSEDTVTNISLIKESEPLPEFIKKALQLAKYLTS